MKKKESPDFMQKTKATLLQKNFLTKVLFYINKIHHNKEKQLEMEIKDCLLSDDYEQLSICVNAKKYMDETMKEMFLEVLYKDTQSQKEFVQKQFKDFIERVYHVFRLSDYIDIDFSFREGDLPYIKLNVKATYKIEGSMVKLDRVLLRAVKQLVEYVEESRTA